MELATVITGIDTFGEWFKFTTAQGFEVSTKHGETAREAQLMIGQPVVIDYVEKPGKLNPHTGQPYINRYLNAISADLSVPKEMTLDEVFGKSLAANPGFDNGGPSASTNGHAEKAQYAANLGDDRGAKAGRNNIAASAVETLLQMTDGKPDTIQRILDGLARWSETGEGVFQDSVPF
jgi:hypothetical protein